MPRARTVCKVLAMRLGQIRQMIRFATYNIFWTTQNNIMTDQQNNDDDNNNNNNETLPLMVVEKIITTNPTSSSSSPPDAGREVRILYQFLENRGCKC